MSTSPSEEDRTKKRKKVSLACVFCRRSHMTCDDGRPCLRCTKRNIGHKCYDTPRPSAKKRASATLDIISPISPDDKLVRWDAPLTKSKSLLEFNSTEKFAENLQESVPRERRESMRENFFLIAADPKDGNIEDRLNQIINAKYEAGYLKPYNYVNGYARLQRYMDQHMSSTTRRRILNVMGTFRPAFREIAQSLTDIDLILVEEAFERLLLDYDRVFSAMAVPACLWRRTGEIYKGNKEFASLIDVPVDQLSDGKLCIYEIMAEESIVNYWEKYGNIAFDPRQKAVLTSCLLRKKSKSIVLSCCFSFTIRRDRYDIPTIIVGNFLPIQIQS
ncbi:hypothetical protein CLU79DRAFT_773457 [Phycomyces nitens]|nr:hypothetical protein CLU79DRAFT_773457 [Phycomyces nitens]